MLSGKSNKKNIRLLVFCIVISVCFSLLPHTISASTINVTSYGADTGDNSNNDTTAVQNAINAASSGDTVYFPNGTYNITSVSLKSGVTLEGQSEAGAIIKYLGSPDSEQLLLIYNISNATVKYLTFNGNNDADLWNGIYAEDSSNILITHVTVKNLVLNNDPDLDFGPHGIRFCGAEGNYNYLDGVTDSEISYCTLTNIGTNSEWGCGIRCHWGSKDNKILYNNVSNTGRGGILNGDGASGLIIKNNTVTESGKYSNDTGEGLSIELIGECHNSVVEDNNVDHWISLDESDYCAVRNNTVSDTIGNDYKWCALENAGGANNNVFTGNIVNNGTQLGISISNVADSGTKEYVYWGYNTIQNCIQWGAQLDGDEDGIRRHYFYKTDFLNTQSDSVYAEYPNDDGHGFRINGNTTYVTLDNCKINNNEALGCQFTDSTVDYISIVGGEIKNNAGSAFDNYSGYNAFEISGVTVSGNADNSTPQPASFGNQKPTAVISGPTSGAVDQQLSFNSSSSSDADGSISHRLWDFGDGIPSANSSVTHTYAEEGTYRVTLVVWDNAGRAAIDEQTITIGSGPTPSPTPTPTPTTTPEPEGEIFSDDFESAFTGWTSSGTPDWYTGSPKIGTHSIRLRTTESITRTISTEGYEDITVSYCMGAYSLDNGNEYVQARWYDGSSWTVLKQIDNGDPEEDNELHYFEYGLPVNADDNQDFALQFKIQGSGTGDYGFVDNIAVLSGGSPIPTPTPTPTPATTPTPTPASTWTIVDDKAGGWTYSGWPQYSDAPCYGGTAHGTMGASGAYGQYTFNGTGVRYYAWKGSDGGSVEVIVDGQSKGVYSLYNGSDQYQVKIYELTGLSNGSHTIRLRAANNDWCMVDYLEIQ